MAGEWAFRVAFLAGCVAGLITFLRGFAAYRKYRLVADTPDTAVRGIAMGLVQIHGQARAEETLLSPVSRIACCIAKVLIEEWQINLRGEGKWTDSATDIQSVKFYLADATGEVLVDPTGAEVNLPPGASREVDSHPPSATPDASARVVEVVSEAETAAAAHALLAQAFSPMARAEAAHASATGKSAGGPTDAELLQYVAAARARSLTSTNALDSQMRHAKLVLARHDPGGAMGRAALEVWKHPQGSQEFQAALEQFAQAYARALAAGKNPPGAETPALQARAGPERVTSLAAMMAGAADPQMDTETEKARQTALANSPNKSSVGAVVHAGDLANGLFRLTEHCLVPGAACHITGTCAENSHARDENDRNIIMKGINEPTFLISSKAGSAVQSSLRTSALGMVLGGGALAIACLALFLQRIGLL